jgi:cobalt-zinc-cadmium efflux system membrane fusion protein
VAEVDEARLPALAVGRAVQVRVAAYPDRAFAGRLEHIGDRVDSDTRRVAVRCTVPNPDGRLKPEMFASVRLALGEPRPAIAVPAAAVQDVDGRTVLFVERSEGSFEAIPVEVADRVGDLVSVRSGVRAGQRVVTSGAFLLKSELLKAAAE